MTAGSVSASLHTTHKHTTSHTHTIKALYKTAHRPKERRFFLELYFKNLLGFVWIERNISGEMIGLDFFCKGPDRPDWHQRASGDEASHRLCFGQKVAFEHIAKTSWRPTSSYLLLLLHHQAAVVCIPQSKGKKEDSGLQIYKPLLW